MAGGAAAARAGAFTGQARFIYYQNGADVLTPASRILPRHWSLLAMMHQATRHFLATISHDYYYANFFLTARSKQASIIPDYIAVLSILSPAFQVCMMTPERFTAHF